MPYAHPLTDDQLADALRTLPGWERDADVIRRTYTCAGFRAAIAFVTEIAEVVEAANHHPDLLVHGYKCVTVTLTTHAAKAVTRRDVELAAEIERIAGRIGAA